MGNQLTDRTEEQRRIGWWKYRHVIGGGTGCRLGSKFILYVNTLYVKSASAEIGETS